MSQNTGGAAGGSKADAAGSSAAQDKKSTATESPQVLSQEKDIRLDGKPKKQPKVVVVLPNGEQKTIQLENEIPSSQLGKILKKIDKNIVLKDDTKVKGFTKQMMNYISASQHGHDVGLAESQGTPRAIGGPGSEQRVVERILPLETDNAPNTNARVSEVTAQDGKIINIEIPETFRREKKNSLNYAMVSCNQQLVRNILSSKDELDVKDGLDVLDCLKRTKQIYRDGISPLQGAVSLNRYNICKHLLEDEANLKLTLSTNHTLNPLCQALRKGYYDIAHLLIEHKANVNLQYEDSFPMNYALEGEKCTLEIVKDIIDAGFPASGVIHTVNRRTVLHGAVKMNHLKIVEYLLTLSVNPNVKENMGFTPLHYAVQNNNAGIVVLLAKNGANMNEECNEYFTPMMYATVVGNHDMVKLLLSLGADINFVTGNKKCAVMPLHYAANCCQFKITQLLLENGAEVNKVVPVTGETPLHSAARASTGLDKQSKIALDCIVQLMIKEGGNQKARHNFGFTPLHVALKSRNISVAKILITNGSDLNNGLSETYTSGNMYTTFHVAAKILDKELIKLCCDYGGNCLGEDDEGMYPCHLSLLTAMMDIISRHSDPTALFIESHIQRDLTPIVKIFWKHRFPYDLTMRFKWLDKNDGIFPPQLVALMQLQKVLFKGLKTMQPKVVQKAIAQGAEVRSCSTDMPYPLHYIAAKGGYIIMEEFLSRGVQVNVLDMQGESALHVAARAGHVMCCRLLLEYGAVFDYYSTKRRKTPLMVAKENGHTEVVKLLKNVGLFFKYLKQGLFGRVNPKMKIPKAVLNCCGRDGRSLLDLAVHLNSKVVVEFLMKARQEL